MLPDGSCSFFALLQLPHKNCAASMERDKPRTVVSAQHGGGISGEPGDSTVIFGHVVMICHACLKCKTSIYNHYIIIWYWYIYIPVMSRRIEVKQVSKWSFLYGHGPPLIQTQSRDLRRLRRSACETVATQQPPPANDMAWKFTRFGMSENWGNWGHWWQNVSGNHRFQQLNIGECLVNIPFKLKTERIAGIISTSTI